MDLALNRIPMSARLPQKQFTDVKKLGWRSIMDTVDGKGPVVMLNHKRPQVVILPVADYVAMVLEIERTRLQPETTLDALRQQFDEHLASLREPGAGDRLRAAFNAPVRNTRAVKVGEGY